VHPRAPVVGLSIQGAKIGRDAENLIAILKPLRNAERVKVAILFHRLKGQHALGRHTPVAAARLGAIPHCRPGDMGAMARIPIRCAVIGAGVVEQPIVLARDGPAAQARDPVVQVRVHIPGDLGIVDPRVQSRVGDVDRLSLALVPQLPGSNRPYLACSHVDAGARRMQRADPSHPLDPSQLGQAGGVDLQDHGLAVLADQSGAQVGQRRQQAIHQVALHLHAHDLPARGGQLRARPVGAEKRAHPDHARNPLQRLHGCSAPSNLVGIVGDIVEDLCAGALQLGPPGIQDRPLELDEVLGLALSSPI